MKTLFLVAVALSTLVTTGLAAPSAKDTLTAIEMVEAAPFSDEGRNAAKVILAFVDESDAVAITLSAKIAPWLFENGVSQSAAREDAANVFLAVYIAGNVKSQIAARMAKDDPYAGWLSVIRAYGQLPKDQKMPFSSIERLTALEKRGSLKDEATKVMKAK